MRTPARVSPRPGPGGRRRVLRRVALGRVPAPREPARAGDPARVQHDRRAEPPDPDALWPTTGNWPKHRLPDRPGSTVPPLPRVPFRPDRATVDKDPPARIRRVTTRSLAAAGPGQVRWGVACAVLSALVSGTERLGWGRPTLHLRL